MPQLYVARRAERKALYLPGVSDNPGLIFMLPKLQNQSQLDELVRSELEKRGVTKEADVHAVIEKAEKDYEYRNKVAEVTQEIKRAMEIKASGGRIMRSNGHWQRVSLPGRPC